MKQEERGNVVPFTPKDARENAAEPAESAEAIELVDTHTHLNDEKFADDVPDAVARARAAGVTRCINMGDTLESSKKAVELAHAYEGLFAGVGIHPEEARERASSRRMTTRSSQNGPKTRRLSASARSASITTG